MELTKDAKSLLKTLIKGLPIDSKYQDGLPEDILPIGVILRGSPLHDDSRTSQALRLLINQKLVKNVGGPYYQTTAEGLAFFEIQRVNRRRWFTENWIAPLITGFVGGVITTLLGTWLLRSLLHL